MTKMPSESVDLLDVNVWLALTDSRHAQHAAARKFWDEEAATQVAFCRITMLGLLRLGTNSKAMGGHPFTPVEIWHAYRTYRRLPEVIFLEEPDEVEAQMATWSDAANFPAHAWTDCYLAAFAVLSGCRFVSFDRGFSRFIGLDFLLLAP
jgi:toxin-antitoxin system PIN domain toxin